MSLSGTQPTPVLVRRLCGPDHKRTQAPFLLPRLSPGRREPRARDTREAMLLACLTGGGGFTRRFVRGFTPTSGSFSTGSEVAGPPGLSSLVGMLLCASGSVLHGNNLSDGQVRGASLWPQASWLRPREAQGLRVSSLSTGSGPHEPSGPPCPLRRPASPRGYSRAPRGVPCGKGAVPAVSVGRHFTFWGSGSRERFDWVQCGICPRA